MKKSEPVFGGISREGIVSDGRKSTYNKQSKRNASIISPITIYLHSESVMGVVEKSKHNIPNTTHTLKSPTVINSIAET